MAEANGGELHDAHDGDTSQPDDITLGLVVVCYALERLEDTLRLIDSIERQTSPIDEVVVVVQKSRELLEALGPALERLTASRVTLRFLDEARGVSRARNAGLGESETDIIAFVDDDSALLDDWAAMTRRFYREHPRAIGVAGAILPLWDSPAMEWFPRELYWMLSCTYWTFTSPVSVRNGYGANMSFRREAFDGRRFSEAVGVGAWGVGGWRGMGGEEPELALRVIRETGQPILFVPDIRAWHRVRPHRLHLKSLARRAYWEGRLKGALTRRKGHSAGVLRTETNLLRSMARAQISRLRLLVSNPVVALRQEAMVLLVLTLVGWGFLESRLRWHRD